MYRLRLIVLNLLIAALLVFGLGVYVELSDPVGGPAAQLPARILALIVGGLFCVLTFRALHRNEGRSFVFQFILFQAILWSTLYGSELVCSRLIPPWPNLELKGFPRRSDVGRMRVWADEGASGYNSWGQKDVERQVSPTAGRRRIIFIGDSFLEDSAGPPVSLRVEGRLENTEVLNLGVSASAPDDYYWRTRNIGLRLKPELCVVFHYDGNDWIDRPTLEGWFGVLAVLPRRSALSMLGLRSLNHLLTWSWRPIHRVNPEGRLFNHERALGEAMSVATDEEIAEFLISIGARFGKAAGIEQALADGNPQPLYQAIREPDEGRFRSYYLERLVSEIGISIPPAADWLTSSERYTERALLETRKVCRSAGVEFLLVLIPEGSQVDARMREIYASVDDIAMGTSRITERYGLGLKNRLEARGVEVLDLRPALSAVRGSYLNLDGHWSDAGSAAVAEVVAQRIRGRVER